MRCSSRAFITLILAAAIASACQPQKSSFSSLGQPAPSAGVNTGAKGDSEGEAGDPQACTRGLPQYSLTFRVAGVEMVDDLGLQLGFPASAIIDPLVSMSVKFERGRMALTAEAASPLEGTSAASAQGKADVVKFGVSAEVNLKYLSIEPRYFYGTPIAEVSSKALGDGIKKLGDAAKALPWKGDLIGRAGSLAVLGAGWAQGVQVGDQFQVFNRERYWSGEPCASRYLGELRVPDQAVATVEVTQVPIDGNTSFAKILTGRLADAEDGAEVVVQSLKPSKDPKNPRALRKQVRVAGIEAEALKLPDGSDFNLKTALGVLVRDQLSASTFYLVP